MKIFERIIMGEKILEIPWEKLNQYVSKVSKQLTLFPFTMLKFSPRQLRRSIKKGRVILSLKKNKLVAFGQIWYYGKNPKGQKVYEFGSWLSFEKSGYGRAILLSAKDLIEEISPGAQLIAIVESNNLRAQKIIEDLGGVKIGNKYSERLKTQSGLPAYMAIFDISKKVNYV